MHNAANRTASNYLMCEKRKCLVVKPPFLTTPFLLPPNSTPPSAYESWEEQAFARDSAGDLGGYVWPPRSYTCSFCRREFRSAQALGGHMNVHRRDRARLNQAAASITHAGETNYDPNPNANAPFLSPEKEIYGELGRRRRIRDFFYDDDGDENDDDGISNKKMNTDLVFSRLGGRQIDGSGESVKSNDQELLKLSIISPAEELDLELRLGP